MTRKDYQVIAQALKAAKPVNTERASVTVKVCEVSVWESTVRSVAQALAKDNGRFDMQRFLEACDQ